MENFILFVLAFSLGSLCMIYYFNYLEKKYIKDRYLKPLLDLKSRGLNIFRFNVREDDTVIFNYDTDKTMYINLSSKNIVCYDTNYRLFEYHSKYAKEYNDFFDSIINKFYKEIFEDVIIVNFKTYSNNSIYGQILSFFPKENKIKKSLNKDDILDKILVSGIESLTEEEKEFLKN